MITIVAWNLNMEGYQGYDLLVHRPKRYVYSLYLREQLLHVESTR